jgi:acyl dehydratase
MGGAGGTKVPVSKFYFEDFYPGRVFEHGPRIVTREEILAFAAEFDPQPMHLDEAAAQGSLLGGLSASGWHACCLFMRMLADSFVLDSASMGAPGVDEVRWLIPVRPGDMLRFRAEVQDARPSKSRPEMGLVRFSFALINQSGAQAMTLASSLMIIRRDQTVRK